jgi:hypothetical protein
MCQPSYQVVPKPSRLICLSTIGALISFNDSIPASFARDDNKIVRGNLGLGLEMIAHCERLRQKGQRQRKRNYFLSLVWWGENWGRSPTNTLRILPCFPKRQLNVAAILCPNSQYLGNATLRVSTENQIFRGEKGSKELRGRRNRNYFRKW